MSRCDVCGQVLTSKDLKTGLKWNEEPDGSFIGSKVIKYICPKCGFKGVAHD